MYILCFQKMSQLLIKLIIVLFFSELSSKEILLSCSITAEIENYEEAKKKIYQEKKLIIYYDIEKSWINDIKRKDWILKYKDDFNKIETTFTNSKKKIYFKYETFFSSEKKNIESDFYLTLEKINGYMRFVKNYYNFNDEVIFVSEVRGICK